MADPLESFPCTCSALVIRVIDGSIYVAGIVICHCFKQLMCQEMGLREKLEFPQRKASWISL